MIDFLSAFPWSIIKSGSVLRGEFFSLYSSIYAMILIPHKQQRHANLLNQIRGFYKNNNNNNKIHKFFYMLIS